MLPATSTRVAYNTSEKINERIRRQTESNVLRYANDGDIEKRLKELDKEWDIERSLETMASSFTLLGLALGITLNIWWLAISVIVQLFFLQHALQGWCPPVPVLRRFGVRTASEINEERYALKALRGDFQDMTMPTYEDPLAAVRK